MTQRLLPIVAALFLLSGCAHKFESADVVVHNATIYTVDKEFTTQQAMAIKDGIIIDMGPEREILNKYNYDVEVDARTRPIYPGLIDAHCHFYGYGRSLQQVNLTGTRSFEEVLDIVKAHSEKSPSEWITGRGWDQNDWEIKEFPTKVELDLMFPNTPVLIRRIDGHAALANTEALRRAGIISGGPIQGGTIEEKDGVLTGILIDNAVDSVTNIIPNPSQEEVQEALLFAQDDCFAVGLTTVSDAGLEKGTLEIIEAMQANNSLKMRIYAMLSDTKENLDHYLPLGPQKTDRLNISSFKFYGDGALGSRGACLMEPYSDVVPQHYGTMLKDREYYELYAEILYNNGWQMNTHCIGDSANRMLLNIYAGVLGGQNDRRWRIEHAQVLSLDDIDMFGKYSIVPSVQPTHLSSDMPWAEDRVGHDRIAGAYAYKKLLEQNGWLPLGTDFPVEDISPFKTFYAAVFRSKPEDIDAPAYLTEDALTREQALRGITIWAAMSNSEDKEKGSLEIGKKADFVILNLDLMKTAQDKFKDIEVISTFINGEEVYSN
jgi:predicted amidohydrolase YtcJ